MKTIVIITAMKEEAQKIVDVFFLQKTKNLQNVSVYEGVFDGKKLVVILGGIGKIQATIATYFAIINYSPDFLINIGIAGNLSYQEITIGDVIFPTQLVQQDVYLPFSGDHLDYAKKPITIKNYTAQIDADGFLVKYGGICATGDEFVDREERIFDIKNRFHADICEMEAFAIASVAREMNMLDKIFIIKSVSDGADHDARAEHMDNLDFAMNNSIFVLTQMLKQL